MGARVHYGRVRTGMVFNGYTQIGDSLSVLIHLDLRGAIILPRPHGYRDPVTCLWLSCRELALRSLPWSARKSRPLSADRGAWNANDTCDERTTLKLKLSTHAEQMSYTSLLAARNCYES